jgi:putative flippase GtrA
VSVRTLREAIGFGLVGSVGFATDAALFLALTQGLALPPVPARLLAFVPATAVTWLLHRHWVFRTHGGPHRKRDEYARHLATQSLGIAVNFACFYLAMRAGLGRHSAQLVPLAIGSLAGMGFNYLGARWFVYRR